MHKKILLEAGKYVSKALQTINLKAFILKMRDLNHMKSVI